MVKNNITTHEFIVEMNSQLMNGWSFYTDSSKGVTFSFKNPNQRLIGYIFDSFENSYYKVSYDKNEVPEKHRNEMLFLDQNWIQTKFNKISPVEKG